MTPGIDIREWPVPDTDITAHFWDFGGQVMVHATHQLFLRESCLYVLVISSKSEISATEQAQYWLEHVKSFGKDAPVLIVGNRADQAALNLDLGLLTEKYPNIVEYFALSCTRAQDEFKSHAQAFHNAFCRELKALGTHQMMFTKQQFAVLQGLRERTPKAAFLSRQEFVDLCAEQEIGDEGEQNREWLLDILDKLGVIVHFPHLTLSDGLVLNPRWLTYGIYTLMYHQEARLPQRDIVAILSKAQVIDEFNNVLTYPQEKCRYIMEAMREFKLCYSLPTQPDTLIIPALLPATHPKPDFDRAAALAFELAFEVFLPRHVMPGLIVARHQEIEADTVWQSGVLLAHQDLQARALLLADYTARKLQIWVDGSDARVYFAMLRDEISKILSGIDIAFAERIILPISARIKVVRSWRIGDTPEQASYRQILAHAGNGTTEFTAESGNVYDVAKVLGVFASDTERDTQIKQIFNQHFYGNNPNVVGTQTTDNRSNNIAISNSSIHGNVTAAAAIQNSFNEIDKCTASAAIRAALSELLKAIESLNQVAPLEQHAAIADMAADFELLLSETARPEPRKPRLGISLDGILEAAQQVGAAGQAVQATTQALKPLFDL